jgi:hypothetical protein
MRPAVPGPAVRALLLCLLLLPAAGCVEKAEGEPSPEPRAYAAADLADIVLRDDERPEGTEPRPDRSGFLDAERFWPSSCCLGIQESFERAGFRVAHLKVFERPGHSADPIDTRPGWEVAVSSAVLFLDEDGAHEALDTWVDYYRAPGVDPVKVGNLGDEAVELVGSPASPAERVYLFVWRRDRLLLSLRASTGYGTVSAPAVRRLVDRMDDRAS